MEDTGASVEWLNLAGTLIWESEEMGSCTVHFSLKLNEDSMG